MHARDVQRGIDPLAPVRAPDPPAPPAPGPPLVIEPPPWSQRYRPPVEVIEDTTRTPAKARKTTSTPRLDATREWRSQQLTPDRKGNGS